MAKKYVVKLKGRGRRARNMADYGWLLELEVTHGVPLIAIS